MVTFTERGVGASLVIVAGFKPFIVLVVVEQCHQFSQEVMTWLLCKNMASVFTYELGAGTWHLLEFLRPVTVL